MHIKQELSKPASALLLISDYPSQRVVVFCAPIPCDWFPLQGWLLSNRKEVVSPVWRWSRSDAARARGPSLLRWRDWGSRYAPVMLGASRHDRQCESDDHGAGQPATGDWRVAEPDPGESTELVVHIRAGVLKGSLGCRLYSDCDAPHFEGFSSDQACILFCCTCQATGYT